MEFSNSRSGRYTKLHSQLSVLSSTHNQISLGSTTIKEILNADLGDGMHRTLLDVSSAGPFVMWIMKSADLSMWTMEEAVAFTDRFLNSRHPRSTTFAYALHGSGEDHKVEHSYQVSILSLYDEAADSILLSYQDRQALEDCRQSAKGNTSKLFTFLQRRAFLISAFILLLILGLATTASLASHHRDSGLVLGSNYATSNTTGLNELRFSYPNPNFTSWSTSTGRSALSWFVRLDDTTLIPSDLADADEHKYTAWYASRYPNYAAMRDSKDYLNNTYWKHTFHTHTFLDIDREFRVTHCVLALKRYWKAMESGRYVCPKDVDSTRIGHCFDVLETFVIPDGDGFEKPFNRSSPLVGTRKPWVVSACF